MCLDNNLVQQGKKLCYECNCGFALKDTIEDRQQQLDCAIEIRLDSRVKECVQINNLVQWAQKLCHECDSRGYNSYYQSSTTIMLVTNM